MRTLDRLHRWLVHRPLLWTFTAFTRVLLALGFLAPGLKKVVGERFTQLDPGTSRVGLFFEGFFQAPEYYRFVGGVQVLAALLLLVPRTALLGALLYLPVIVNILVITVSLGFQGTWVIAGLMTLANLFLVAWDYDRLRPALSPGAAPLPADHRPAPAELRAGCPWRVRLATAAVCGLSAVTFVFAGHQRLPGLGYAAMALGLVFLPLTAAAWWRGLAARPPTLSAR